MWVNFKAKWRNQTVGELFLKTAERLPDKVSNLLLSKVEDKAELEIPPPPGDDHPLPREREGRDDLP